MINCYQFYKMDPETKDTDPEKLISKVEVFASRGRMRLKQVRLLCLLPAQVRC